MTREVTLSPSAGRLSLNSLFLIFPVTSSAKLMNMMSSPMDDTLPVNSVPLGLFFANVSKISSDNCFIPSDILSLCGSIPKITASTSCPFENDLTASSSD